MFILERSMGGGIFAISFLFRMPQRLCIVLPASCNREFARMFTIFLGLLPSSLINFGHTYLGYPTLAL